MPDQIVLVEDDQRLATLTAGYLARNGYDVTVVHRGDRAVGMVRQVRPSLVLLDVMLPGEDGLSICRKLRAEHPTLPILMLTSLADETDQIIGLEVGADDYVTKPVSPRLLLARVRALLRRKEEQTAAPAATEHLVNGAIRADPERRELSIDGALITLTTAEFELAAYLLRRVGQPLSRQQLLRDLRGIDYDGIDRSIDVLVSQLRRKLGVHGRMIKTVRGVGYQLARAR